MMRKPIIAIDGPSGAGKSTVSRGVAAELDFIYIDTGAMYRCVGLLATREYLPVLESVELTALLNRLDIRFEPGESGQQVFADGENVTEAIRRHEISKAASDFSALPCVRAAMVAKQREMGRSGGVVMEGRDIGTNVFPDAEVKIFLTASSEERARRRVDELREKGMEADYEQILRDQLSRDENDRKRALNPLIPASDAHLLDTTGIPIQKIIEKIVLRARKIMGF